MRLFAAGPPPTPPGGLYQSASGGEQQHWHVVKSNLYERGICHRSQRKLQAASNCLDHPLHGSWHLQRGSERRHHVRPTSNMVPLPFVTTDCPSVVWNQSLSPAPEGGLGCCPPLRRCSPRVELKAGSRGFEENLHRRLQAVQFVARRHASIGGAQLWAGRPARARERRARRLLHRRLLLQLVQLRVHLR